MMALAAWNCVRSRAGWVFVAVLGCLLAACVASAPAPQLSTNIGASRNVTIVPMAVSECELEAFVAFDAARNASLFHESEAKMLAGPNIGPFQVELLRRLFTQIAYHGFVDYKRFGADQYLACAQHEPQFQLPDVHQVVACMARIDLVMDLKESQIAGLSIGAAGARAKRMLESKPLYLDGVIDQLVPQVYAAQGDDAFWDLRQQVFESCMGR